MKICFFEVVIFKEKLDSNIALTKLYTIPERTWQRQEVHEAVRCKFHIYKLWFLKILSLIPNPFCESWKMSILYFSVMNMA